jgi:Ser/Thr protein kinase RdoA (MazF antagonist)
MWQRLPKRPRQEALGQLLAKYWNGKPDTLVAISQSANKVYRFETTQGELCYARLSHEAIRPYQISESAVLFQSYLRNRNVSVARPIRANTKQWLIRIGEGYYVGVVEAVAGDILNLQTADEDLLERWGRTTANLHENATYYVPDQNTHYHDFHTQWKRVAPIAQRAESVVRQAYCKLDDNLRNYRQGASYILTHGDYHAGNIIVKYPMLDATIIDFDEPVYHWAVADIARVMLEFTEHPLEERIALRDAFLRGYRTIHPLSDFWVVNLPFFMQLRGMLMHLWTIESDLPSESDGSDSPFQQSRLWAIHRYNF